MSKENICKNCAFFRVHERSNYIGKGKSGECVNKFVSVQVTFENYTPIQALQVNMQEYPLALEHIFEEMKRGWSCFMDKKLLSTPTSQQPSDNIIYMADFKKK